MLLAALTLLAGSPFPPSVEGRGVWSANDLPFARVHGLALAGGRYMVGGLDGLYIGQPGGWTLVSKEPVRQIAQQGDVVWVLFGSGAVDKFEPTIDRRYPDAFYGSVRRPWCSCLSVSDQGILAGGQGGWIERGPKQLIEHYPEALKGQIVTALLRQGSSTWVGTQSGALFRFSGAKVDRWTPAHGLMDPWVTSLCLDRGQVVAGTYTAGLFRIEGRRAVALPGPGKRVRHLLTVGDELVVGLDQGAYRQTRSGWQAISPTGEETTGLALVNGRLAVLTHQGVRFLP